MDNNNTEYSVQELLGMIAQDESVDPDPNMRQGIMFGLIMALAQL